jgi:metal-responsive CopG/Arc/MetJ family transcriptional regulator
MELQHENDSLVVSTSHAHLDNDSCLEGLMVHGKSAKVEQFADRRPAPVFRRLGFMCNIVVRMLR